MKRIFVLSEMVITVENLSKRYFIQHKVGGRGYKSYTALRDVAGQAAQNLARRLFRAARSRQPQMADIEAFWALQDISFEIKKGEVIGVIGRNGAGKSTLLKVLTRITEPTTGRITMRGRVASLLEVGTGFHPELTGRENIYLNGAILGMSAAEIRRNFDEIVAFAEVEKFLDTPVKRYSSGMYVRLAFAVAAHLEAEILLVDEVLAVGDAEFQRKCLSKLNDVVRENRTVLFVSHNMGTISSLTKKCMLFDRGRLADFADTQSVIQKYLSSSLAAKATAIELRDLELFRAIHVEDPQVEIKGIQIKAGNGDTTVLPNIGFGSELTLHIQVEVYRALQAADIGIVISNASGWKITELARSNYGPGLSLEPGRYTVSISVGDLPLAPGRYSVDAWIIPILGVDAACDVISDYPLFSIVKEDHIDHYQPPIPWGAVHCRAVSWDLQADVDLCSEARLSIA